MGTFMRAPFFGPAPFFWGLSKIKRQSRHAGLFYYFIKCREVKRAKFVLASLFFIIYSEICMLVI